MYPLVLGQYCFQRKLYFTQYVCFVCVFRRQFTDLCKEVGEGGDVGLVCVLEIVRNKITTTEYRSDKQESGN